MGELSTLYSATSHISLQTCVTNIRRVQDLKTMVDVPDFALNTDLDGHQS